MNSRKTDTVATGLCSLWKREEHSLYSFLNLLDGTKQAAHNFLCTGIAALTALPARSRFREP